MAKNGFWSKNVIREIDLFDFTSFLVCTFSNFLAHSGWVFFIYTFLKFTFFPNQERMSPAEWNTIYKMSTDRNLYTNLINSLFPTIHGNDEVKRGILLMLFGGVGKTTHDMTKLRGDVNICVVGDPSTGNTSFKKKKFHL